jgi:hypothetical protein
MSFKKSLFPILTDTQLGKVTKAIVDIGIGLSGAEQATPEKKEERLAICRQNKCGNYMRNETDLEVCSLVNGGCGCFLDSKTGLENQTCPRQYW